MNVFKQIKVDLNWSCAWEWEVDDDGFWHHYFVYCPQIKLYGAIFDDRKIKGNLFYEDEENGLCCQINIDDAAKLVLGNSVMSTPVFKVFATCIVKNAQERERQRALLKRRSQMLRNKIVSI